MTKYITCSLTDELKKEMEKYPEVNWSNVCRTGIEKYIEKRKRE